MLNKFKSWKLRKNLIDVGSLRSFEHFEDLCDLQSKARSEYLTDLSLYPRETFLEILQISTMIKSFASTVTLE